MNFIEKIRRHETRFYQALYGLINFVRNFTLPRIRLAGQIFNFIDLIFVQLWRFLKNQYYYQILVYKCKYIGKGLRLDGDLPLILGDGQITIGNNVYIGNRQTWVVGLKVFDDVNLTIGDNTTLNYQTLISVAKSVTIGNNCKFAGEIKIFDNNSHPLDYIKRRNNEIMSESDVSAVYIEDDVWIGTQTIILKGVTIGKGAVIGAGSIVTKSIPPYSLAVGNPASVIKNLNQ